MNTPSSCPNDPAPPGRKPRALVIDDDDQMRKWMHKVLELKGFAVESAPEGVRGMYSFLDRSADVVVCDLFMPDKEGLETILELRSLSPEVRIIAVSGGGAVFQMDQLPTAEAFGADRTLKKPFTEEELMEAVDALLNPSSRGPMEIGRAHV